MILGTAAYMSPEQARGKPVDKRADIWAFGCVLYEMLTGRRAFEGEDVSDTLAAVLRARTGLAARCPHDAPRRSRMVLQRCLEKDRKRRASRTLAMCRLALEGRIRDGGSADGRATADRLRGGAWRSSAARPGHGAVVAGAAVWFATRPAEPVPPRVSRLPIAFSPASRADHQRRRP